MGRTRRELLCFCDSTHDDRYDSYGKDQEVSSLSTQGIGGGGFTTTYLTLQQIRELDLGKKDKPDFFSCKALVTFVRKENMLYKVRT